MRSIFRLKRARFGLLVPLSILSAPAFAAGALIDPDPRSPSLAEILQREEALQAKAAQVRVADEAPAPTSAAVVPVAAATPAPAARSVRQVYPAYNAQPAVTVLVPGRR